MLSSPPEALSEPVDGAPQEVRTATTDTTKTARNILLKNTLLKDTLTNERITREEKNNCYPIYRGRSGILGWSVRRDDVADEQATNSQVHKDRDNYGLPLLEV